MRIYGMDVRPLLSYTFPRDPVCIPPSSHQLAFFCSFVKSGTHPTSFPFQNSLMKYGWEGGFAYSEIESWHSLLPGQGPYHSTLTGISLSPFPAASSWNSACVKGIVVQGLLGQKQFGVLWLLSHLLKVGFYFSNFHSTYYII